MAPDSFVGFIVGCVAWLVITAAVFIVPLAVIGGVGAAADWARRRFRVVTASCRVRLWGVWTIGRLYLTAGLAPWGRHNR